MHRSRRSPLLTGCSSTSKRRNEGGDDVTNDASELRSFAAEMGRVEPKVERQIDAVVRKGALNIKNTLREDLSHSRHFGQVAKTISYDIEKSDGVIEAEIGPNKYYRSARLANIAYFGTSRGGGQTADFDNGLRKELPNLTEHLRRVMGDVL